MQIIEDKTLLLRTRYPDKIQNVDTACVVDITEDIYTMEQEEQENQQLFIFKLII